MHHECPHQYRNYGRAGDAEGEERNQGRIGVSVVGCLRPSDPLDHPGPELLGGLRHLLLDHVGHECGHESTYAGYEAEAKPDTRAASDRSGDSLEILPRQN